MSIYFVKASRVLETLPIGDIKRLHQLERSMPKHSETRYSPYSPEQLHAMVLDIALYPDFLPWCRAARVISDHDSYFLAELVISFKHMTERYTSKVQPNIDANPKEIHVDLVSGPFEYLTNHWRFEPLASGGTNIHFAVDFKFKSRLLESLIGGFFSRATEKMTVAFLQRADTLYGNPHQDTNP